MITRTTPVKYWKGYIPTPTPIPCLYAFDSANLKITKIYDKKHGSLNRGHNHVAVQTEVF